MWLHAASVGLGGKPVLNASPNYAAFARDMRSNAPSCAPLNRDIRSNSCNKNTGIQDKKAASVS